MRMPFLVRVFLREYLNIKKWICLFFQTISLEKNQVRVPTLCTSFMVVELLWHFLRIVFSVRVKIGHFWRYTNTANTATIVANQIEKTIQTTYRYLCICVKCWSLQNTYNRSIRLYDHHLSVLGTIPLFDGDERFSHIHPFLSHATLEVGTTDQQSAPSE